MAILVINSSSSKCGNCHRGADPSESGHYTTRSYDKNLNGQPGCGEKWDSVMLPSIINSLETREQVIQRLRDWYGVTVADENWVVLSIGELINGKSKP